MNPPNANTPLSVALVAHGSEHRTLSWVAHNGDPTITVHIHDGDAQMDSSSSDVAASVSTVPPEECGRLYCKPSGNCASPYLRSRCPQCFGGSIWGNDVKELVTSTPFRNNHTESSPLRAPDVIVTIDGNMQHCQYTFVSGEMILPWNETCIFLTNEELNAAACHVAEARKADKRSAE